MSARDLLAAATPRPWHALSTQSTIELVGPDEECLGWMEPGTAPTDRGDKDAALIVVAVNEYEPLNDVVDAARALLADDDMPNHWGDCACSYCTLQRAVRAAFDRLDAIRTGA